MKWRRSFTSHEASHACPFIKYRLRYRAAYNDESTQIFLKAVAVIVIAFGTERVATANLNYVILPSSFPHNLHSFSLLNGLTSLIICVAELPNKE
jgi:hypothetical protein